MIYGGFYVLHTLILHVGICTAFYFKESEFHIFFNYYALFLINKQGLGFFFTNLNSKAYYFKRCCKYPIAALQEQFNTAKKGSRALLSPAILWLRIRGS